MALPKKVKKYLPLIPEKVGRERRQEMLDYITDDGTYLPKGVLHADLDGGVLDFVKNDIKMVSAGKNVPVVDKIITNQNWAQFTTTWDFKDLDKNIKLPFITTVRQPEVKYGTFQGGLANIPNRRHFFYYTVPTWDGDRKGADVYKIPQPIPVDIKYNIKLFCNRMSELNEFNKIMMQSFTSKQSYVNIKGHYMPLHLEEVSDESAKEIEKRKYYIANYTILLKGFILDEEEFQVSPAISRYVTMFEVDVLNKNRKVNPQPPRPDSFDLDLLFVSGVTELNEVFRYTADITINGTTNLINCYETTYSSITNNTLSYINCSGDTTVTFTNVGDSGTICVKSSTLPSFVNTTGGVFSEGGSCASSYSVFINNNYLGDNVPKIQINDGDTLKIIVYKDDLTQNSIIKTKAVLV